MNERFTLEYTCQYKVMAEGYNIRFSFFLFLLSILCYENVCYIRNFENKVIKKQRAKDWWWATSDEKSYRFF